MENPLEERIVRDRNTRESGRDVAKMAMDRAVEEVRRVRQIENGPAGEDGVVVVFDEGPGGMVTGSRKRARGK